MKKIIKKSDCYSIEKVNQRISFYNGTLLSLKEENELIINKKLLTFWENYKLKNYPDEKLSDITIRN